MAEPSKEVYELQYMLRKIAQITGEIPLINPDGIYGEDTRAAVRDFQAQNGITPNGEVGRQTWDAIFEKYKESIYMVSQAEPIYPFPSPSYTSQSGERSDIIVLIQLILSALAVVYDDFEDIVISGENDAKTQEALKRFQGYNGLAQTGVLDKRTWDAAAKSFNAYYNNSHYSS